MKRDDDLIAQVRLKADPGALGHPASIGTIEKAEKLLGVGLPPLLRRLYLEVGDGGFGPGYGFLPLLEDEHGHPDESIVGRYRTARGAQQEASGWAWPVGLLPACDWGCAIMSCVDGTEAAGPVVAFDDGAREDGESMERAFLRTHDSIEQFLLDWIADVDIRHTIFRPEHRRVDLTRNPFTGGRGPHHYHKR
jgi:hypothetical protein